MKATHTTVGYRRTAGVLSVAIVLLTLCACSNDAISARVEDFADSVTAANGAIATYYGGLNEQEVELYFQMLELDPTKRVGDYVTVSADNRDYTFRSPLSQLPFDEKVIQERIAVLSHLTAYSRGLAELAGAASRSAFQANMSTLKGKLEDLEQHFASARDAPGQQQEAKRAKQYAGALEDLVGVVGKWYLNSQRWSAVRRAVVDGEKPVNTLLDFVAEDLQEVQKAVETGADDRYTTAIVYYNLNRQRAPDAARIAALEQIRRFKQAWDAARKSRPDAVVQRLKKTHTALVRVAKEDRTPVSLAALNTQLELYKDDVQTLVASARVIAGLNK